MNWLVTEWRIAVLLLVLSAACGGDSGSGALQVPVASGASSAAGISGGSATTTPGSSVQPSLPAPAGSVSTSPPLAAAGHAAPTAPPSRAPSGAPQVTPPVPAAGSGGPPVTPPAMMPPPASPPAGPPGTWPDADPAKTGPFMVVEEKNVGPGMGFTMYRPMMLTQKHPVITWGNGTGSSPQTYGVMLKLWASHGFIVIASNSPNVGQGSPPPMLNGVTWVLEQDMTEGVPLYQHVDRDRIGASGHSQGAFATTSAGSDPRIKTIAPIQTFGGARTLHGPVLALCGGMDTLLSCDGNLTGFQSVKNFPAMYANLKAADHAAWSFSPGIPDFAVITNAWFRVHLMNDMANRSLFYGPDCGFCKDAKWEIMRSMMDN